MKQKMLILIVIGITAACAAVLLHLRSKRMRWFKTISIIISIGLAAVTWWCFWPFLGPSYHGHTLSEWVEACGEYRYNITNDWASMPEIEEAIQHSGRRSVPFLLYWIRAKPNFTRFSSDEDRQAGFRAVGAVSAFRILGTNATFAIPDLMSVAQLPDDADIPRADPAWGLDFYRYRNEYAVFALANLGPTTVPFLLRLATNSSVNVQRDDVYLLSTMGTNALPAIPLLLHYIQEPTNRVSNIAARSLGTLKLEPSTVGPALANALANKKYLLNYGTNGPMDQRMLFLYEVFHSLGTYGPQADSALPAIIEWLHVDDWFASPWAADSLGNFTSEPKLVVPALTQCLENRDPYLVASAAQSLGKFGSSATSAVPALIKVFENTNLQVNARNSAGYALERITNSVPAPVSEPSAQ
ncbi:MAG: HEAT repeat domain-containing protein [Limisphaerales bacterium]